MVKPFFEADSDNSYRVRTTLPRLSCWMALCLTRMWEPQYKIELRMRNHNTMSRNNLIQEIAKSVHERHKVDLENPEVFILVEVFKVCTC